MGRPKGSQNRNRAVPADDAREPRESHDDPHTSRVQGGLPIHDGQDDGGRDDDPDDDSPDDDQDRPLRIDSKLGDRARKRAEEIEKIVMKYRRGAALLGMSMNDVDRAMGDRAETMSRRARHSITSIPLPPPAVAMYQSLIPLSREYLQAEGVDDLPDDRVLDRASTGGVASKDKAIRALATVLADRGIATESQIERTVEFVVALGYLKMEPQEVFDAAMKRKMELASEEFERVRKGMREGREG